MSGIRNRCRESRLQKRLALEYFSFQLIVRIVMNIGTLMTPAGTRLHPCWI